MCAAPAAMASAFSFGQPSRGFTSLRSVSPKLPMARAAAPIFSPSCGLARMMAGEGKYLLLHQLETIGSAGANDHAVDLVEVDDDGDAFALRIGLLLARRREIVDPVALG